MTDLTAAGLREFNKGIIEEFRSNGGKVGGPSKAPLCCCSPAPAPNPASAGSRRSPT